VKIDIDTNDNINNDGVISFWYIWKNDSPSHLIMTALSNIIIRCEPFWKSVASAKKNNEPEVGQSCGSHWP
jgi:hypothetical protein